MLGLWFTCCGLVKMDFFKKLNSISYKIENKTIPKQKALNDIQKFYGSMNLIPKGNKRLVKNEIFQVKRKIMFKL